MRSLALEHGVSLPTIRDAIRRQGAEPRRGKPGRPLVPLSSENIAELRRRYEAGESQQSIADDLGMSQARVSRALGRPGRRHPQGAAAPGWKGGRVDIARYPHVWLAADDPMAVMRNAQGYVAEHRLVMARELGRPLDSSETVHHINGDRADARIENLQLRQGRHGKHVAHRCADCGSANVVAVGLENDG